jgi:enoyl-CoA hydratase
MSQHGPFRVERRGEVTCLTMDDGKANVFLGREFEALEAALEEIEKTDAGAVVLTGRPKYFTAGLNLKLLPGLEPSEIGEVIRKFGRAVVRLFLFEKPVVAAVNGHGLGAGAIFAFASDVRLFAQGDFKFGLNEVPGGIMVPHFGVEPARAALSPALQTEMIVHGRATLPGQPYAMTKRNLRGAAGALALGVLDEEVRGIVELLSGGGRR